MNPTDIETMFEIKPDDMPKMSSVEGGRPTFTFSTNIPKISRIFNFTENVPGILGEKYLLFV